MLFMSSRISTGVPVTQEDWQLLGAYYALLDAGRCELSLLYLTLAGQPKPIECHAAEDLIDFLAQRHGLPALPGGGYEIDYDLREYAVERGAWEEWKGKP